MNVVKAAKPTSRRRLPAAPEATDVMPRKEFLREMKNLLTAYPRDQENLGWRIETRYGPVEIGDPDTPSRSDVLYLIPIRFVGTQEQFMEFWNTIGRFEKCSPNGKWNIFEKNPRKAFWLLSYRLRLITSAPAASRVE